jgi:prepilin-type N-terminal cleavage/methylation domain-containing protein
MSLGGFLQRNETQPRRSPREHCGFALVEVLVAAAVAALVVAALIHLQIELRRAGSLAIERGIAAALAEGRSEGLLSQSRAGFAPPDDGGDDIDLYARRWSMSSSNRAVTLAVEVSWPEPEPVHEIRLTSASETAAALASGYAAVTRHPMAPP